MTVVFNCPIIGCVESTVEAFITKPDSLANRDGSKRTNKKHLKQLTSGLQTKVAIGRYPNGTEVIIDGHSRKAAWAAGSLARPERLFVDIFELTCFKEECDLIDIFCGKASQSTPSEKAEQARNRNGLTYNSDLCNSPWTAAMKAAGYNEDEGYAVFNDALVWLDQFDLTVKNTKRIFSAGVRAAFLETFIDRRQQASIFWTDYVKEDSELPGCIALKAEIEAQNGWGGATSNHFKRVATQRVREI